MSEVNNTEEELTSLNQSYRLVISQSEKYKLEINSLKVKISEDANKFEKLYQIEEELSTLN